MAQLVERYVRNVQATSSNLVISTTCSSIELIEKGCYDVTAFFSFIYIIKSFLASYR